MNNRIFGLVAFVSLFYSSFSYGQNSDSTPLFVNEFLNIGVGAEAHGLFGSVVATTDDITAAFWNPAGLSSIESDMELGAMHASWFGGIANYDYVGFGKRLDEDAKSFGSISLIRMGIDNIPNTISLIGPDGTVNYDNVVSFSAADYAILLSYGRALFNENLRIGGSGKIIHRSIGSFAKAWGFGLDLGVQYHMGNFSFGVMGKDITSTFNAWTFSLTDEEKLVFQSTGNVIPESSVEIALPRIIIGGAYKIDRDRWSLLAEADLNISTNGLQSSVIGGKGFSIDPTFGTEFGMNKKVFIRLGLGNIQKILNDVNTGSTALDFQPNVGLGLALGNFRIDYALTNIGSASDALVSHVFSVAMNIGSDSRGYY